jgi:hypothetical protein
MKTINTGLRALTTSKERQELRAIGTICDHETHRNWKEYGLRPCTPKLRYRGRMAWMVKAGHDGRIWDVISSNNEYATLTLDGLKERKII